MKTMKWIIILAILIVYSSCTPYYYERESVVKTKIYVGKFEKSTYIDDKYSYVKTTQAVYKVKGHPQVEIGSWCYIRIELCRQDVTREMQDRMATWYFTWDGTFEEYKVKRF